MCKRKIAIISLIFIIFLIHLLKINAKPQYEPNDTTTHSSSLSMMEELMASTFILENNTATEHNLMITNRNQSVNTDKTTNIKIIRENGKIVPVYLPTYHTPRKTTERTRHDDDRRRGKRDNIIFPDDTQFIPKDPLSCSQGSTYCLNADNYPDNHVQNILNSQSIDIIQYKELFGDDVVEPTIKNRFDNSDDWEENLCSSDIIVIHPKLAEAKDKTWKYIVNTDTYNQGVRVEICTGMDGSNGENKCIHQNFPNRYKAICKQKYIYRPLLAINSDGVLEKELFKIPSCCQCVLKNAP